MSEVTVPITSWWVRLMQLFGREKPQPATPEPEPYSTEKVLAMAKRVALKTATYQLGPEHYGLLMSEQMPVEGGGIVSAEKLQFVKRWTEVAEHDPLRILFLLDCPEWNNPYPITDWDNHLNWLFDKQVSQDEAYKTWKRGLLLRP